MQINGDVMSNFTIRSFIAIIALSSAARWAYAQTPVCYPPGCNPVVSDTGRNTGAGTNALLEVNGGGGADDTAAGYAALAVVWSANGNTGIGSRVLYNNDSDQTGVANYNTGVGFEALYSNVDGANNTAVGVEALQKTTGGNQTAVGAYALQGNTSGTYNTAIGNNALQNNQVGASNTATGYQALIANIAGSGNTATGYLALAGNDPIGSGSANYNTATGAWALYFNTNAGQNTAVGYQALYGNDRNGAGAAADNTATGYQALYSNSTAANNTAMGYQALFTNDTSGSGAAINNTAVGFQAMYLNSQGYNNTAFGLQALYDNTSGAGNAAQGAFALQANTSGSRNTALGNHALQYNNGNENTVLGFEAGYVLKSGSNNIDIGSPGGTASESNTIRIGTTSQTAGEAPALAPQTATYIAGIYGVNLTGSAVFVTSSGQLVAPGSSERFKTDIRTMPQDSAKLSRLRPVTFRYKTDVTGTTQYGLIAEEVAKVYPELVIRDDSGKIQGVRYEELAPMLLNEVQKQQQINAAEHQHARTQDAEIGQLKAQLAEMRAALVTLQSKDQLVAQR
jgi:trimeric autotransporter adhesin